MKLHGSVMFFLLVVSTQGITQHVVITTTKVHHPSYVCYDGRTLEATNEGYVWLAKRSCFITRTPCSAFQAGHYGIYNNTNTLRYGYARCRQNYPFRLGQMQTH